MSGIFWRNFSLCFSKLIRLPSTNSSSTIPTPEKDYLKRPSSPTTIIIKNFNSTYDLSTTSSTTITTDDFLLSSDTDSSSSLPDFAAVFASQRFFFSSPGGSNSIIESTDTRPESKATSAPPLEGGGVAIKKYSRDPYKDFKLSMQEMIESRDTEADAEYLCQLLLCYLSLNATHTHKFIISAFADIFIAHLSSSEYSNIRGPKPEYHPQRTIST